MKQLFYLDSPGRGGFLKEGRWQFYAPHWLGRRHTEESKSKLRKRKVCWMCGKEGHNVLYHIPPLSPIGGNKHTLETRIRIGLASKGKPSPKSCGLCGQVDVTIKSRGTPSHPCLKWSTKRNA